ncbi:MAG: glycosyltransferase [Desulfobacterales bacterium]|nr:MAG: glycosyltransferase [Desulfobacterales bacterium]
MKVLQVYKDYYPPIKGGIEGHLNLLANGLRQQGVAVEVLVSNTRPKLVRTGIQGVPITKVPQLGRFQSAPLNPTLPYWIRKLGQKADVLHFHFPNPTAELSYLVSGLQRPVVVTYHSDIVRQKKMGKIISPFLFLFLKKAHTIIVTSSNYLHSSRVLQNFKNKCKIIPHGIDIQRFAVLPETCRTIESLRQKYGGAILLFVGRFRYYKGLDVLIEATPRINGKVLLIGSGPLEKNFQQQIAAANLADKVVFLGEVSDEELHTYLHACDVFLLPSTSRSEAFGIVQLEAMSCGKPVVCTELTTGTSFVNQHEKTGLVVPPNDAAALAAAVNFLLNHKETREKYGRASLERVTKYFTKEKMIAATLQVYQNIISTRRVN